MRLFRNLTSPAGHVRLNGGKVYLRSPTERDWRAYVEVRAASRKFLEPWEPTWPPDALGREAYFRRLNRYAADWRDGVGHSFFIFGNDDNALLGGISMSNVRRGVAQCGTLGYWIGEPHARQGYMNEALRLIIEFCFGQLGLHRIEAACLPHNDASQKLLQRADFTQDGYARKYLKIRGEWQDHLLYSLLAEDHKSTSPE
ncbi:MAG: GNAT family protein [Alphaproteobacteria bacterium]|nr:GNAT family protein [Alphaproteobacteria bacterium]MCZ6846840.1 GNAT family protein [Alphaproteobacteria bacterium]